MITICLDGFTERISVLPFIHITWRRVFLHRNKRDSVYSSHILLTILIALIALHIIYDSNSAHCVTYCLRFW